MKKEIILEVFKDYNSRNAYELYKDDLISLCENLDIRIENSNNKFYNILESVNSYKKPNEYKKYITVSCKGYTQSEFDNYKIYFNSYNDNIKYLQSELEKLFTHKNDYIIKSFEVLETGHKKEIEDYFISITNIEFPENTDIKKEIQSYNIDFDKIKFNNN